MAKNNIEKELEEQEKSLQEVLKGIQKMPNKAKGSIDNSDINYYTTPLTTQTTISNSMKTENDYKKLLKNKVSEEEFKQVMKSKDTVLKNRISARITLLNPEQHVGIINIIGILPEELGLVHEHYQGTIIPSNEWHERADELKETLNSLSKVPVKVIVEDVPEGTFKVERVIAQVSMQ